MQVAGGAPRLQQLCRLPWADEQANRLLGGTGGGVQRAALQGGSCRGRLDGLGSWCLQAHLQGLCSSSAMPGSARSVQTAAHAQLNHSGLHTHASHRALSPLACTCRCWACPGGAAAEGQRAWSHHTQVQTSRDCTACRHWLLMDKAPRSRASAAAAGAATAGAVAAAAGPTSTVNQSSRALSRGRSFTGISTLHPVGMQVR